MASLCVTALGQPDLTAERQTVALQQTDRSDVMCLGRQQCNWRSRMDRKGANLMKLLAYMSYTQEQGDSHTCAGFVTAHRPACMQFHLWH